MRINKVFRSQRQAKKINQENLANALGMSAKTFRKYENGEIELSISQIMKLANILGLDAQELIINEITYYKNTKNAVTHNFNSDGKTPLKNILKELQNLMLNISKSTFEIENIELKLNQLA